MTTDDRAIDLCDFYEPRLARLQAYADALDYPMSVEFLRPLLRAGDIARFEMREAYFYRLLLYALWFGTPDCIPEARVAHEQYVENLVAGRADWDAIPEATAILQGRDRCLS